VASVLFCLLGALLILLDRHHTKFLNEGANDGSAPIRLADFKQLTATFWVLALACCMHYAAVLTFIAFGIEFISGRFDVSDTQAATTMSFIYLTACVALPPCGLLIDRFGHRVSVRQMIMLAISLVWSLLMHHSSLLSCNSN